MVLLCFLLDLRTLSPTILRELKQYLLHLANLYTIGSKKCERQSEMLTDRIGLCYIQKNRVSCSDELKIAYCPRGNFSLRDFHHAVNYLPAEGFCHDLVDSTATKICGTDAMFAKLLSKEFLYSWGSKGIAKRVIFVSSCLVEDIDSLRRILIDAADKCVSVEFLLLEQEPGEPNVISQNVQEFANHMFDLKNCSIQTHFPDALVLCGLVKRWLQELKDNLEEPLQAVFLFKDDLAGSMNQIFCNLFATFNQIIDGFGPCKTSRCHGLPLDGSVGNEYNRSLSCPISYQELEAENLIENAVKVGEQTILFFSSSQSCPRLQQVSAPITFHVIERTSLSSLNEGVIIGGSYIVAPLASFEDEPTSHNKSQLNTQLFQGLCLALQSLDQGLVCSSNCNMETMREATFQCFYILLPSDNGPMLLRRLAGSEEFLPIPDAIRSLHLSMPVQMQNAIQASLSKIKLRDYNPHFHERGLHPKLNNLVKESLQFGSIPAMTKGMSFESNSPKQEFSEMTELPASSEKAEVEEQISLLDQTMKEDKTAACVTKEWEQLIVNEDCNIEYPNCTSTLWTKISTLSPLVGNKQAGDKTSKILERLEVPRQQKMKVSSVVTSSIGLAACLPKNPLAPLVPNHATNQEMTLSQPMRPSFQRLKRKQRDTTSGHSSFTMGRLPSFIHGVLLLFSSSTPEDSPQSSL